MRTPRADPRRFLISAERPVALVTGASSGIGAAFAERLASEGFDLIVVARRRARLQELATRLEKTGDARVTVREADLTDPGALLTLENEISSAESLAMVVNNAGFGAYRPFTELDPDIAESLIRIHCVAPTRITRAALPGMIARGRGSVINIASLLAFSQSLPPGQLPHRATYAACKSYEVTFTVTLRQELEGTGVRALVCCPGLVETEFHGPDWRGPPRMDPALVVNACLKGIAADEAICIPTAEDAGLPDRLHDAQRDMLAHGMSDLASRYK